MKSAVFILMFIVSAIPATVSSNGICLAPFDKQEITEVENTEPVMDPRCDPPCQFPPCDGYENTVRPAVHFKWKSVPGASVYRIDIRHLITGDVRHYLLGPESYRLENGECTSHQITANFLPPLYTPEQFTIPMIGPYQWDLIAWRNEMWQRMDSSTFIYLHNSNPFGTAVIAFHWKTKPEASFCNRNAPVDYWIHLPMEYPFNHPGRSGYEWGYVFIQTTSDLLPETPVFQDDYAVEFLPLPDDSGSENIKLWIRNRYPDETSELAYHLAFTLEEPWTDLSWDVDASFDLASIPMPVSHDIWPEEIVAGGYLDPGLHTAPFEGIVDRFVWCDPYAACVLCPWTERQPWTSGEQWCCACWEGMSDSFCKPPDTAPPLDPADRSTWKGKNVLQWIRKNRIDGSHPDWSIDDNLRALDRLMCRWPNEYQGTFYPWVSQTAMYMMNDLLRLCDPLSGLDVEDHWRFTDTPPENFFQSGIGCSFASTHFGLSMARLMNFPARATCMAHYHNDLEIWLPYRAPKGPRYTLEEGEWVRFVGEWIAETDWSEQPPDPGGGPIRTRLRGILKTTDYITWDPEDSIPFNWYLSGSEPEYTTCRATLIDRQWPYKLNSLALPDATLRIIAVWPTQKDFCNGEGLSDLRNIGNNIALGQWLATQHLIPLGANRFGYVFREGSRLDFVAVDEHLKSVYRKPIQMNNLNTFEEPGRFRLVAVVIDLPPYIFMNVNQYEVSWDAPTPTPIPSQTPVPTCIPTVTPSIPPLGITLNMPQCMFRPGDIFYLYADVNNPEEPLDQVAVFIILDVYGYLFFGPSWTLFDPSSGNGMDAWVSDLPTGSRRIDAIPPFVCPEAPRNLYHLYFIGAITDIYVTRIIGAMDTVEWGFD
ncbi:hypothetical protein JW979_00675 [bacterium]|nr:hypothetical protein [candidate division CSSED10-310 bacterium]